MASKVRKKSLADKINSLVTTTPINFDSDDEADETKAKVIDRYDESDDSEDNFQASEIRRRNVDPLDQIDERYKGKKVSRKDAYQDEDDFDSYEGSESVEDESNNDTSDNNDDDDADEDEYESKGSNESNDSNESSYDSETDLKQQFPGKVRDEDASQMEKEKGFQTMSRTNMRADIDKGNCVRSQLKLWESLLEIRIKLQKCLTTSNQMPQHDVCKDLKADVEYAKKTDEAKNKLKLLLNNMLQLQSLLFKQYPETKNLFTQNKKRKAEGNIEEETKDLDNPMDEEIPSDTEDENEMEDASVSAENNADSDERLFRKKLKLDNYEKILNENHKSYTGYRNGVIEKWNEKTRIATGKLGKGMSETTLKQIEFALSDKEKTYKRTRLKRSEYKIVGKTEATDDNEGRRVQEYDSEIYDDDDFYHQLLRDLIEYKSSDVTDPVQLSKQWIQLQNMRSKMKRKIDTRATKGRRIRYNVHNKLVNFMAPITINDTWTDHAKDELYNSLFGKIKPATKEVDR